MKTGGKAVVIQGVVGGEVHGTARPRNEKIADLLYVRLPELRGYDLGTLNVRVTSPGASPILRLRAYSQAAVRIPAMRYEWRRRPLGAETIYFVPVRFSVEGKISPTPGYLYLPSRSSRPRKGILELMSEKNLKKECGVREGDRVEVVIEPKVSARRGEVPGRILSWWLYNAGMLLALVVGAPFIAFKLATTRRFRIGLNERWTLYGAGSPRLRSRRSIWIQAASVGEVSASLPLVRLLKEEFRDHDLVVTTQTATGRKIVRDKLKGIAAGMLCPLDLGLLVKRFVRINSPRVLILVETELWPGLITVCARSGIPVVMVNGRLSRRAFRGYMMFRKLLYPVLQSIALFNMRSEEDARRMKRMGASPDRIYVTGNIKYDAIPAAEIDPAVQAELRESIGLMSDEQLLIGGSTFEGEEAILIEALATLLPAFPRLRLLLAPRYLERVEAVCELLRSRGLAFRRFSREGEGEEASEARVVVLDALGVLYKLYSLAAIVFIGRSLRGEGGQNPIEPACWGKPVIFGPHMENFHDIARDLVASGGALQIKGEKGLVETIRDLLSDPERRRKMGEKAREAVWRRRGASQKSLEAIRRLLNSDDHR